MVRRDLRREHECKALEDQLEPEGDLFAPQPALSMPSAAVVDAAMMPPVAPSATPIVKPTVVADISRETTAMYDDLGSDAWSRRL